MAKLKIHKLTSNWINTYCGVYPLCWWKIARADHLWKNVTCKRCLRFKDV